MPWCMPTIPSGARPTRIAFFDDRIEIENPGVLVPGMTIEDMRQGVSKIRNHVIARVFRELGLIEQWGSGVPPHVQRGRGKWSTGTADCRDRHAVAFCCFPGPTH